MVFLGSYEICIGLFSKLLICLLFRRWLPVSCCFI
nr:MAG TPA: protein of unknown function (DUF5463) [Caudoviricetes sp.]DAS11399.1 MAG TPA: protein of unknown function (DUF5463) [Caudoviricetes sp.]